MAGSRNWIEYGPGYRVYLLQDGPRLILLFCGGDKSSQDRDTKEAHRLAKDWMSNERDD